MAFRVRVHAEDCDLRDIAASPAYFRYADRALVQFWESVSGSFEAFRGLGYDCSIVAGRADFLHPAQRGEDLLVRFRALNVGATSFDLATSVNRGGVLIAQMTSKYAILDGFGSSSKRLTDDLRESIEAAHR